MYTCTDMRYLTTIVTKKTQLLSVFLEKDYSISDTNSPLYIFYLIKLNYYLPASKRFQKWTNYVDCFLCEISKNGLSRFLVFSSRWIWIHKFTPTPSPFLNQLPKQNLFHNNLIILYFTIYSRQKIFYFFG